QRGVEQAAVPHVQRAAAGFAGHAGWGALTELRVVVGGGIAVVVHAIAADLDGGGHDRRAARGAARGATGVAAQGAGAVHVLAGHRAEPEVVDGAVAVVVQLVALRAFTASRHEVLVRVVARAVYLGVGVVAVVVAQAQAVPVLVGREARAVLILDP